MKEKGTFWATNVQICFYVASHLKSGHDKASVLVVPPQVWNISVYYNTYQEVVVSSFDEQLTWLWRLETIGITAQVCLLIWNFYYYT